MQGKEKYNLPPEFDKREQRKFYQMALESSDVETGDNLSSIYLSLNSPTQYLTDKKFHSAGGMKVISKVNDLKTHRQVAMAELKKQGNSSQEEIDQFLREAQITATLEHPNIVPIYEIGLNTHGKPFFTMKFLEDKTLKKVLRELLKANPFYARKYTTNILLEIFLKVCEAASYAHSSGIVHLDIKPDNIMLGDYGEVYLCDWGLAKQQNMPSGNWNGLPQLHSAILADITLTGIVKGTPGFMAPEQIDDRFGEKTAQTDIYAIGALLYCILTFKRPYAGLDVESTLKATLQGELPSIRDVGTKPVPESLEAICVKATAIKQEDRYGTVDEIINDIRSFQEGFATNAEGKTPLKPLWLFLKRNKLLSSIILVAIVAGGMLTVILGGKLQETRQKSASQLKQLELSKEQELTRFRGYSEKKIKQIKANNQTLKEKVNSLETKLQTLFSTAHSIRGRALVVVPGDNVSNTEFEFSSGTLAFWFKPTRTSSSYPMLFKLGNTKWHVDNTQNLGGLILEGGKEIISPKRFGEPLWNKWHHFAVTVSPNSNMTFYVDGIEVKLITKFAEGKGLYLGTNAKNPPESLTALFDEVSVWNKVFTHEQVIKLANKVLRGDEASLEAYYKLDGNGNDCTDNGHHLKISPEAVFKP